MPKIKESWVKCPKCSYRFPSPIFIGSTELFEQILTQNNGTSCPKCGEEFSCDRNNMSYVLEDGRGGGQFDDFGKK